MSGRPFYYPDAENTDEKSCLNAFLRLAVIFISTIFSFSPIRFNFLVEKFKLPKLKMNSGKSMHW